MEKRSGLSTIFVLLIGIAIGIVIATLLGMILCYIEGETLSTEPKTFGDIKVWAQKPPDAKGVTEQGIHRILWMTKNDNCLLMITQNEAGKNIDLSLFDNTKYPILKMEFLNTPGKWGQACYAGHNEDKKVVGDFLVDINFDGHFDVKYVWDDDGKIISANIFFDGEWQRVNNCRSEDMVAVLGETKYIFDPNSGWQVSK